MIAHFILFVRDQKSSTEFYTKVLQMAPTLDVPGMTEFQINENCLLGLMPEAGIKNLLGPKLPDPAAGNGALRAEIYLLLQDASEYYERALAFGAVDLSAVAARGWGDTVGYCMDADGHVLAFAQRTGPFLGK